MTAPGTGAFVGEGRGFGHPLASAKLILAPSPVCTDLSSREDPRRGDNTPPELTNLICAYYPTFFVASFTREATSEVVSAAFAAASFVTSAAFCTISLVTTTTSAVFSLVASTAFSATSLVASTAFSKASLAASAAFAALSLKFVTSLPPGLLGCSGLARV